MSSSLTFSAINTETFKKACKRNKFATIKYLINILKFEELDDGLIVACKRGNITIINLVICKHKCFNVLINILKKLCKFGRLYLVQFIMNNYWENVEINDEFIHGYLLSMWRGLLFISIENGHMQIANYLIKRFNISKELLSKFVSNATYSSINSVIWAKKYGLKVDISQFKHICRDSKMELMVYLYSNEMPNDSCYNDAIATAISMGELFAADWLLNTIKFTTEEFIECGLNALVEVLSHDNYFENSHHYIIERFKLTREHIRVPRLVKHWDYDEYTSVMCNEPILTAVCLRGSKEQFYYMIERFKFTKCEYYENDHNIVKNKHTSAYALEYLIDENIYSFDDIRYFNPDVILTLENLLYDSADDFIRIAAKFESTSEDILKVIIDPENYDQEILAVIYNHFNIQL